MHTSLEATLKRAQHDPGDLRTARSGLLGDEKAYERKGKAMITVRARHEDGARILITDPIAQEGIDLLRYELPDADIDVRLDLSEDQLMSLIGDYTVLIIRSQTHVTEQLLAKATHLQIIGRAGSGLD